ncbi:uncharacterized protein LOC134848917, partial [Symsagittifera roscoffensis]|uniref:uncharacterized protein LOC134848917 n=1 Tax=Symsagittifera roscoffensis TaxID=84072 RepID=UPI00307B19A8
MSFASVLCFKLTFATYDPKAKTLVSDCNECRKDSVKNQGSCLNCRFEVAATTFNAPSPKIIFLECKEWDMEEGVVFISFNITHFLQGTTILYYSLIEDSITETVFSKLEDYTSMGGCDDVKSYPDNICSIPWAIKTNVTQDSQGLDIIPGKGYKLSIKIRVDVVNYEYLQTAPMVCESYMSPPTLMEDFRCVVNKLPHLTNQTDYDQDAGNFTVTCTWDNFNQREGEIQTIEILFNSDAQVTVRNHSLSLRQISGKVKQTKQVFTKDLFPDLYYE